MASLEAAVKSPSNAERSHAESSPASFNEKPPVHGAAAPVNAETFKIVKVRKPDGTIIKVKRQVAAPSKDNTSKHTSETLPKDTSEKTAYKTASNTSPISQFEAETIGAATTITKDTPPQVQSTRKGSSPSPGQETPVQTTTGGKSSARSSTKPVPTKEPASSSRLARGFHRLHRNIHHAAAAINPLDGDDFLPDEGEYYDSTDSDDNRRNGTQARNKQVGTKDAQSQATSGYNGYQSSSKEKLSVSEKELAQLEIEINEKQGENGGEHTVARAEYKPARGLRKRSIFTKVAVALIMITIPLLFIIMAILTISIQNNFVETSTMGEVVQQTIKVAITAWPIVFAAILSQSLKAFASYRVERGIRLMTLEQLINSHSVGSVIRQPFILRRLDLLSVALICLWGLSPITTYAMQHMSTTVPGYDTTSTTVWYLNTTGENLSFNRSSSSGTLFSATLGAVYSAAFLPINTPEGEDAFGNPLIPIPGKLKTEADSGGWYAVQDGQNTSIYSSIYGIPLSGVDEFATTNFTIPTGYWNLNCSTPTFINDINSTGHVLSQSTSESLYMGMEFNVPVNQTNLGTIHFASTIYNKGGTSSGYAYATCAFNQTFINAHINCNGTLCVTDKVQFAPEYQTTLPTNFTDDLVAASYDTPSFTERYILSPDPVDIHQVNTGDGFDLSTVSADDLTERLSILVNTFWLIGFAPMYITVELQESNVYEISVPSVDAVYTNTRDAYSYSQIWIGVVFATSSILALAGIAGVIFEARTIGPNVLGFASSIVRHNKYIDAPKASSAMSGPERARELGNIRVMMQDVKAGDEVGKIALGAVNEGAQRLKPGRLYR